MARARWLIAPAALMALAGCGSSIDSSMTSSDSTTATGALTTTAAASPGAPTVIHLAKSASAADSAATNGSTPADQGNGADGQIEPMPIQPAIVTYVTSGDLPALGGSGPSWQLPIGAQPDPAQIGRVARALGVQGEVTRLAQDQGGGWVVGSGAGGPSLQVSADGLLSWWYTPAAAAAPEPVEGQSGSTPDVPPRDGRTDEAGGDRQGRRTADGDGPRPGRLPVRGQRRRPRCSVTAWQVLDGRRSPLSTNFGFGAGGELTWAGGSLATPVRGPDYPLVSTDSALVRLNDQQTGWLDDLRQRHGGA